MAQPENGLFSFLSAVHSLSLAHTHYGFMSDPVLTNTCPLLYPCPPTVIIVGHTSCGGILASLSGAQGEQLPPSESLQRYLKPLVNLCKSVRDSMGLSAGQEPSDSAAKDELLIRATEANVREQVRKVIESKVVQANWSGKRVAFPGKPSAKVKVHG